MMPPILSAPVAADPHRDLLISRHAALTTVNGVSSLSEEQTDELVGRATATENLVIRTPAITAEGAAIKMLVLLQMAATGHQVSDDMAWPVAEEAAALLGIPTLADLGYPTPADQIAREAAADVRS